MFVTHIAISQGARFLEETARLNSLLAGRREALEEWKKEELKKKQVSMETLPAAV